MMIETKTITNQTVWQKFFNENCNQSFLQSWEWGEFQKKLGYEILRLEIYNKSQLSAIAQIIKIKAKRGNFLFIPHGPIFKANKNLNIKFLITQLLNYLITLAKSEGFSFIRIAPLLENTPENQKIFSKLWFRTAPIYMHAETVWALPLTSDKTDDELLSQMRKTTRYLIRKAQREGVVIEKRTDNKAVDDFYKIYEETARRENFAPFSKEYIRNEFEAFKKSGNALFLFGRIARKNANNNAEQRGNPHEPTHNPCQFTSLFKSNQGFEETTKKYLASSLILFTHSTAFYHQGASIHTKIPIPYLLQWEAIKEARRRGCQFYNFWGIYDEETKRMPKSWQGLTLFKTGFGGQKIQYLPTQDYIVLPKYYLTYIWEKFLGWKRGM